jgi:hypothetical protein
LRDISSYSGITSCHRDNYWVPWLGRIVDCGEDLDGLEKSERVTLSAAMRHGTTQFLEIEVFIDCC